MNREFCLLASPEAFQVRPLKHPQSLPNMLEGERDSFQPSRGYFFAPFSYLCAHFICQIFGYWLQFWVAPEARAARGSQVLFPDLADHNRAAADFAQLAEAAWASESECRSFMLWWSKPMEWDPILVGIGEFTTRFRTYFSGWIDPWPYPICGRRLFLLDPLGW